MDPHHKINYVEFPAREIVATKAFFNAVFNWSFTDYGPEYTAFEGQGIDGGFYYSNAKLSSSENSALIVLYSNNLESTLAEVTRHGGTVIKPIFEFPGGRRFHFTEPSGNELAVWSDKTP